MNKFTRKIFSVVTTGSLLLNLVSPVSAMTLEISGNGSDSYSKVDVDSNQTTSVVQSNEAKVENNIQATATTGDNKAEGNTGGDVKIETGDATTDVTATTAVNSNVATVDCCAVQDVDVKVSGNGADSTNKVYLDLNQGEGAGTSVFQNNEADVDNDVYAKAETGDNEAEDNTGGNVSIDTGDATTSVTLSTVANANWAKVGGGQGDPGSVSLTISGNGTDSYNKIDLDLDNEIFVIQSNEADVENDVYAKANTGDNEAEDNTGGEASIETGDASTTVEVDNAVNFNWADVDCGCLFDVLGKITGNGEDSSNKIEADLESGLEVFQGNCDDLSLGANSQGGGHHGHDCEVENDLTAKAATGENEIEDSTGSVEDPSVNTGDADTTVTVSNEGNSNVYGAEVPSDWPNFDFNFNVSLTLAQLMALLGN